MKAPSPLGGRLTHSRDVHLQYLTAELRAVVYMERSKWMEDAMLRQTTIPSELPPRAPHERLIGPIRLMYESDPWPENEFTEFHIRASIGTTFNLESTFEVTLIGRENPTEMFPRLIAILNRAEKDSLEQQSEWSVYFSGCCVPVQVDSDSIMHVAFILALVSRPGRPVMIALEPLADDLPKIVALYMDSLALKVYEINPMLDRTDLEREIAGSLLECIRLGVAESSMLFNCGQVLGRRQ